MTTKPQEKQDFSPELKQEVKERDNYRCQKCGSSNPLHVAHIEHRKMGGDDTKNFKENLITLCDDCHKEFDNYQFDITKWEPNNKEDGLRIVRAQAKEVDGKMRNAIAKENLYFYNRPSEKGIEVSQRLHKQAVEQIEVANRATYSLARTLEEQKNRTVDGKPAFKHREKPDVEETYEDFTTYLQKEIIPKIEWGSKTVTNYISAVKSLKPSANDIIGTLVAVDNTDLPDDLTGMGVKGLQNENTGKVDEVYERNDLSIMKVIEVDDWKEFEEGEEIELEDGTTVKAEMVQGELSEVLPGNYSDLASVINKDELTGKQKKRLVDLAKEDQGEFRKEKRDLLSGGSNSSGREANCLQCLEGKTVSKGKYENDDGEEIKIGSKNIKCPVSGMLKSTLSKKDAKQIAKKFDKKENCFNPRD